MRTVPSVYTILIRTFYLSLSTKGTKVAWETHGTLIMSAGQLGEDTKSVFNGPTTKVVTGTATGVYNG